MSIIKTIVERKVAITELGHIPVSIQPWEKDDDGLMYANSLLNQLEEIQEEDVAETMRNFIRQNRAEIDNAIHSVPGMEGYRLNDEEREGWIQNDEGLYNWARLEGVNV